MSGVFSHMPNQTKPGVKTPGECRELARDCRAMAGQAHDELDRTQWLLLAESWELLAAERDKEVQQK